MFYKIKNHNEHNRYSFFALSCFGTQVPNSYDSTQSFSSNFAAKIESIKFTSQFKSTKTTFANKTQNCTAERQRPSYSSSFKYILSSELVSRLKHHTLPPIFSPNSIELISIVLFHCSMFFVFILSLH